MVRTLRVLPLAHPRREVLGFLGELHSKGVDLFLIWALPAIAITFHEAAHGFAARLLGDDTAWRLGRVTFNR